VSVCRLKLTLILGDLIKMVGISRPVLITPWGQLSTSIILILIRFIIMTFTFVKVNDRMGD
jgi:hypothetical protein